MKHSDRPRPVRPLQIAALAALIWTVALGWMPSEARAAVQGKTIEYRHGDAVLEGYLAYDDAVTGPRP